MRNKGLNKIEKKRLQKLIKSRKEKINEVVEELLEENNSSQKFEDKLLWIEKATIIIKYLQALKSEKNNIFILLVVVFVISSILSSIFIKKGNLLISGDIYSSNLVIDIDSSYIVEKDFGLNYFYIEGIDTIYAPALDIEVENEIGEGWLNAKGKNIRISKLFFAKNAQIALRYDQNELHLAVKNAVVKGSFLASDSIHINWGEDSDDFKSNIYVINSVETIDFISGKREHVPHIITMNSKSKLRFRDVPVKKMFFKKEYKYNSGIFKSSIKQGEVIIEDTKKQIKVKTGDHLNLLDFNAERVDVSFGKDIRIQFEGIADEIHLGPDKHERNLTPFWLEYLYQNEPVKVIAGLIVFLISIYITFMKRDVYED